ncbi:MAG: DUF2157 domain-containing protein [Hyphomicrobiaceae bacterium]
MLWHRQKLERQVERWHRQGWVTDQGLDGIRDELHRGSARFGLAGVLGVLGATLIGFGVMMFVGANWQEMPRLVRLSLLGAGMWAAYGLAAWLYVKEHPAFGHAAVLLGSAIFGASIMLIAQMYHIEGHPPGAVLVWGLGTALAAVLFRSNPAYALAIGLAGIWGVWETNLWGTLHWPYLAFWGALFLALTLTTRWRFGYHLLAFSLSAFVVLIGYLTQIGDGHWLTLGIGLAITVLAVALRDPIDRVLAASRPAAAYGLAVAFAALFSIQFLEGSLWGGGNEAWLASNGMPLWLLGAGSLVLLVGGLVAAAMTDNRGLMWVAYAGISLELLGIYFRTFGTLLDTSLFFLIAGVLVVVLAVIAYKLVKLPQATAKEAT